jgi:hypothetical protein
MLIGSHEREVQLSSICLPFTRLATQTKYHTQRKRHTKGNTYWHVTTEICLPITDCQNQRTL